MTLNPIAIGFSLGTMTLDVLAPRPKLVPIAAALPSGSRAEEQFAPAAEPAREEPAAVRHLAAVA
jgi:hypothetical protein